MQLAIMKWCTFSTKRRVTFLCSSLNFSLEIVAVCVAGEVCESNARFWERPGVYGELKQWNVTQKILNGMSKIKF